MKDNATILDACCGGKMFYFDKDDRPQTDTRTPRRQTQQNTLDIVYEITKGKNYEKGK